MINGEYIMVIVPKDYPGKKYRGKYCYEHYLVYWKTYGIVPNEDEIIHHKNEDKHFNVPENLELMKRKDHSSLHKENLQNSLVLLKCPGCQRMFFREKRQTFLQKGGTHSCCSKKCASIVTHLKKIDIDEFLNRISKNVVQEFRDKKSYYNL